VVDWSNHWWPIGFPHPDCTCGCPLSMDLTFDRHNLDAAYTATITCMECGRKVTGEPGTPSRRAEWNAMDKWKEAKDD
jgi:hypothetical protein